MNTQNFSSLNLTDAMLKNLEKIGYKHMTPIQAKALPFILKKNDLIAKAKTGSGKTAAFGIGLLSNLDIKKFRVQSLVLCPTRELADQVANELRQIAKFAHNIKILTLCGGVAFGPQLGSLRHQAHIIVGTPGRVLKHLNKNSLSLQDLNMLVLDEADRMLDMGFIEEIQNVIDFAPKKRQTLLFSATYPDEIKDLCKSILDNPIEVEAHLQEVPNEISEYFYEVKANEKVKTLVEIFSRYKPNDVIVFCNTKLECDELAGELQDSNIDALALHGDLEQYERNDVLVQFSNKSCPVLVATDVAARGLDIKDLDMVVNYNLPFTQETYTHRIGRTGRAGAKGISITLYIDKELEKADEYKDEKREFLKIDNFSDTSTFKMQPEFVTLVIEGGKKDKLRKGDILGSLTGDIGLSGENIGKIDIYDRQTYVALKNGFEENIIKNIIIKKKRFTTWIL
ncbi:ATP-dependent RNA helicase DbpA [Sulfurimonas lithotrophica]|uniref:DEAD-box ATP-dependent RNA helicase RhpA n=1 Tax=Sulfurimonas lithotrophica TaxID=2590022 RepID=A0A5P8P3S7_9BACT|nr:ATP-dependent RNA helicase DbpA [Sulfurimonas lithotrophica]QFR50335.1 ATP-dependent RNA helicase DbpA [Sulfurimonas lithotrophica]